MKAFVFAFVCLVALLAKADVNPGLRTTLSNDGLEYARSILQPLLVQQLKTITIPDMEDDVHIKHLGSVHLSLTDIATSDFTIDTGAIKLSSPNVGTVALGGISISMSFNWRYKCKLASDHGTGTIHTSGASTSISGALSMDPSSGAPVVTLQDIGFDCGDLDIHLSGGASWLYNSLISCFKGKVHDIINDQVRTKMADTIKAMLAKALSSVPLTVDFQNGISLAYALADQPSVFDQNGLRIAVGSVAESYPTKEGRGHSSFQPSAMPKSTATSAPGPMLELFINDYAINTLSYSYYKTGNTNFQIDDKNAPEEAKPLLVSGYYSSAAPGLIKKYGMNAPMRIDYELAAVPTLIMQPDGAQMKAVGRLYLEASDDNKTFTSVIGMQLEITMSASVTLQGTSIMIQLGLVNSNATLVSSSVGDVDIDAMKQLIDFTITYGLGMVNDKLASGVPLPVVKGITFVDPKIVWGANYLAIATGFSYNPNSLIL